MQQSMNIPYVKQFDNNGVLLNPIKGSYLSEFHNRRARREKSTRFYGESKNYHLTVTGTIKYLRLKQYEFDKEGNKKVIEHYILK